MKEFYANREESQDTKFKRILEHFENATLLRNGSYRATCPAHNDKNPSLSITRKDNRVLLHCFAGCELSSILSAASLNPEGLALEERAESNEEVVYRYVDLERNVRHETVKITSPGKKKTYKQRRPDGKGGYIWDLKGVETVLYYLPTVVEAVENHEVVFIVEGEKDAETLCCQGIVATTNPMGAMKWKESYSKYLKGADVAILPDNDAIGVNHANEVAMSVSKFAKSVKIVCLPVKGVGEDVTDWIEKYNGDGDKLMKLVKKAPNWEKPSEGKKQQPNPFTDYLSEFKLAERMLSLFGDDIRYDHLNKEWYVWDGIVWGKDVCGKIPRMAKETILSLYGEAQNTTDDDRRRKVVKFAFESETDRKLKALVSNAQVDAKDVKQEDFDKDIWLLNVNDGTLDLSRRGGSTAQLHKHRREDLITKIAPVSYNAEAKCPSWIKFLDIIMDGNDELIEYLQRVVGYCLTGDTSEQCIFILYGEGENGKSTFLDTIQTMLGDYALTTRTETILARSYDSIPNEIARLHGARLVVAMESPEGRRLNESLVKTLTGGDTIASRFLYHEVFEYRPQFKLFIGTNHKLVITGTDHAIWRRIKLIPFSVKIPARTERVPKSEVMKMFKQEEEGILAWAVRGCMKWKEEGGLKEPRIVKSETRVYRSEMDKLGDYIKERCVEDPEGWVVFSGLYADYKDWCIEAGDKPLSRMAFGMKLQERGYKPDVCTSGFEKNQRIYRGIRMNEDARNVEDVDAAKIREQLKKYRHRKEVHVVNG
jgi:putative DNA primase/helicase